MSCFFFSYPFERCDTVPYSSKKKTSPSESESEESESEENSEDKKIKKVEAGERKRTRSMGLVSSFVAVIL